VSSLLSTDACRRRQIGATRRIHIQDTLGVKTNHLFPEFGHPTLFFHTVDRTPQSMQTYPPYGVWLNPPTG